MEALILLGLIVLNGAFAMSEIALVTARKARLMKQAADGDAGASVALKLGEDPTRFLSTIQIGITSIGILNGIVGQAVLAAPLSAWLAATFDLTAQTAGFIATASVVIVVTYISIVIGELVPKRLGQISPEPVARLVARPMHVLSVIAAPFVYLLSASTHGLLRLMRVKSNTTNTVTEEEIQAMLEEGSEAGIIELPEHEMVRNIFRLDDRQLGSLMIPRSEIVYLDINLPPEDNMRRLIESEHSRFPVCDGGLDKVLGVIHAKQALLSVARGETPDFTSNLQPSIFVMETMTGLDLLEQFRNNGMQLAFVIDEYGDIEGIVTLTDVLEAVAGEFHSEHEAWATERENGSWLLDGAIPIPELKDKLELRHVPEEERSRYHTLGGMLMLLLGRIPATGDCADWEGWRFEVVDMDGKRIDKVLAVPLANSQASVTTTLPL